MNRFSQKVIIVNRNLDGFSLANRSWFAKFAKLSSHQTFLLYSIFLFPLGTRKYLISNIIYKNLIPYETLNHFKINIICMYNFVNNNKSATVFNVVSNHTCIHTYMGTCNVIIMHLYEKGYKHKNVKAVKRVMTPLHDLICLHMFNKEVWWIFNIRTCIKS